MSNVDSPVIPVRGIAAWRLLADFVASPIACMDRHAARLGGPAIRIEPPCPWRRDGGGTVLMLIGADYNRRVLTATDRLRPTGIWPVRGPEGSALHALRRNFLVMHGAEHSRFSEAVASHLKRSRVTGYFDAVKRIALEEIDHWPAGEVADVSRLLRDLAQRYAFTLLFGEGDPTRIRHFGAMLADYHRANWSPTAALLRLNLPFMPYRSVLCRAEALQDFLLDWMAERHGCPADRDVRAALAIASHVDGDAPACPHADRAAKIVAAAHLAGFALASYETTATTLAWTLLLLACHPGVAAALADEVASIGPLEAVDDPETLAALPLLDAVIKETMRLIAPVPVLGFKTLRAGELAGFDLPVDTTVMLSPHLTHRAPEIYAEPDRFMPERWRTIQPTTYEYLPFSGGPRRCPGFHFAQTNLRMALCAIVSRYRLALPQGVRIDHGYAAVTVPRGGVPMRILPQDGRYQPPPHHTGSFFDLFQANADTGPA